MAIKFDALDYIVRRRMAQLEALNRYYATLAIEYFLQVQPPEIDRKGKFWHNRTAQAAARVFSKAVKENNEVGWMIAHGVKYGKWLELSNDRRHEALWPIVKRFAGRYLNDVKKIFGG